MSCLFTQELACLYFPSNSKRRARRLFTQMIIRNQELYAKLELEGWQTNMRILTPRQLDIIYSYVGRP